MQVSSIFTVQLHLEKGSFRHIRHMYFDGVSCRNYSFKQCHCREKLAARKEAKVTWLTSGQLNSFRALARPCLQKGSVHTRQRLCSQSWKQRAGAPAQPRVLPFATLSSLITSSSISQRGRKLYIQSGWRLSFGFLMHMHLYAERQLGEIRLRWAMYLDFLYSQ